MKALHLQPLVGFGNIKLGMTRTEVLLMLGPCSTSFKNSPASLYPTDAWLNNGLRVFYSGTVPRVEYIELSRGAGFEVELWGHPVFSTKASLLIEFIELHSSLDREDPELGYSYTFPSIELSLWRPIVDSPDGQFFSTIGIGVHGYYSGVN
ncbi:hypothetical protein ACFOKJ_12015 [Vogesella amnigena]|uniref:Phage tail protein n=1 Tax=Vogesella amnigena TaxID=1507449 RepID=A0ABV7TVW7_9NEIS